MSTLRYLTGRNTRLFFRDKGTFFSAMIAPLVLLLLFMTFLGNVYRDSFNSCVPDGIDVPSDLIEGFVGGWLFSSLLAVCCVTVAFTANMIMVQDKVTGAVGDLTIAPIKRSTLAVSYYISTAIVTAIVCYVAMAAGLIYIANAGWYLTISDILLTALDVLLLILFGTALSSIVCHFLNSQGGMTAVSVLVSAAYGFVCGAYMPISQFSEGIQHFVGFIPGTYGTSLLRQHLMGGVIDELEQNYFPKQVTDLMSESFDLKIRFFDHDVTTSQAYMVMVGAVVVLLTIFVLLNMFKKMRRK